LRRYINEPLLSAGVTLCRPFQRPVRQPAAAAGSTNEDMLRRSEFPGQRSRCVEQLAACAAFTGHITVHFKDKRKTSSSELSTTGVPNWGCRHPFGVSDANPGVSDLLPRSKYKTRARTRLGSPGLLNAHLRTVCGINYVLILIMN